MNSRKEHDALGELDVPNTAYWGINTQRAVRNFKISGQRFPEVLILSLARVKKACVKANLDLGEIDNERGEAILRAIDELLEQGRHMDQFPVDVFQTGSGTQVNMNMNEVLANRANEIMGYPIGKGFPVRPNDHVNKSQSSNDVIPTAMNLSAFEFLNSKLIPSISFLKKGLKRKIRQFRNVIKVGRTHLQDAVPIRLSTEFEVYLRQVELNSRRIKSACHELCAVPIGGTAVGTGIDSNPKFGKLAIAHLSRMTGFSFRLNPVKAEGIASHNSIANASSELRLLAFSVLKMANDIRWLGSGPRAGLGELKLPAMELGSSIMPGKINPTQSEMLMQVCMKVIGNDTAISLCEVLGSNLDLNVAKPLMIVSLLESIELLSNGIRSFVQNCLEGLEANADQISQQLDNSLMVAIRLVPIIGYEKASEVALTAVRSGKTIKQVVVNMGLKIDKDLDDLLDPRKMV